MGYLLCTGSCYGCGRLFTFNPDYVPSLTIEGERRPFCGSCVERANVVRETKGLALLTIHPEAFEPLPEGGF